ncbi:MAG: lipid IV(A) 3-deoxy-D-manno-octulosonic acid transferase [Methylovulum sp.]|nr:lipid IV(A) 3-deoxy-D-manno-octulosonic acid transferase [Methylovulum sp.]
MRALYSSLFYLLIPLIMLRLIWRSIKAPGYLSRWYERFAIYDKKYPEQVIWFHAVSVGEAEAVFPLIRQIQCQHPDASLLVTTTTPTGSARVTAVLNGVVAHVYLPYDLPDAVNRFMRCFKPRLAVIMETEIWPNLYASCGKNGIPLYVINARLSEKSARGYQKIPSLIRPALAQVKQIATQTQDDRQRFIAIGAHAENVITLGNIKFDINISADMVEQGLRLKADVFGKRLVWICASTHKGEEKICLDIYQELKPRLPDLLLLIAPRHPERFSEVKKLCGQLSLDVVTRTSGAACTPSSDIYLIDTLGELKMLYVAADIAFIGGSMVPVGGHNILEAAAAGVPVLFGPYMANFKEIALDTLKHNAAIQCLDKDAIVNAIVMLSTDLKYRDELAARAKQFVQQNQGAMARICEMLPLEGKPA